MQGPSNTSNDNTNTTPLYGGGAAAAPGQTLATGAAPMAVPDRSAYLSALNPTDTTGAAPIIPGWSGPGMPGWWDSAMQPADITAYNAGYANFDQNAANWKSAHAPQGLGGVPGAGVPEFPTSSVTSAGGNVWKPGPTGGYISTYNPNWDPSQGGSPYGPSTGLDANGNYDFSNLPPNYGANQVEFSRALSSGEPVDSAVARLWGWTPDMGAPAPPGSRPPMMAPTGPVMPGDTFSTTPWKGTTPYTGMDYTGNYVAPPANNTNTTPSTSGDQTGDPARWNALISSGAFANLDPATQSALKAVLGL